MPDMFRKLTQQLNRIIKQTLNVMFSHLSSTDEFSSGKWCNAIDAAWIHSNTAMISFMVSSN